MAIIYVDSSDENSDWLHRVIKEHEKEDEFTKLRKNLYNEYLDKKLGGDNEEKDS